LTFLLYFGKVHFMSDSNTDIWKTSTAKQLAETLAVIDSTTDMQNFLRDVMTEKEITEISARLEAARMLTEGKKYAEIVAKTKLSSRTVARISDWLQNGCKGYAIALNAIHHDHTSPASAE
jgi:TrpR-related protein YerC/YecD